MSLKKPLNQSRFRGNHLSRQVIRLYSITELHNGHAEQEVWFVGFNIYLLAIICFAFWYSGNVVIRDSTSILLFFQLLLYE